MIGVTAPLKKELAPLLGVVKNVSIENVLGRKIYNGTIGKHRVSMMVSGHGKIQTAANTQLLIAQKNPRFLFHMGSAGTLSKDLKIGQIVLGTDVVEHDYYCKFHQEVPPPIHKTSEPLNQSLKTFSQGHDGCLVSGIMVSGNEDIVETPRRDQLFDLHGGLSVDWETAASVHTCNLNQIENVALRAIVDYAYENTHKEFDENIEGMSTRLCRWIFDYLAGDEFNKYQSAAAESSHSS